MTDPHVEPDSKPAEPQPEAGASEAPASPAVSDESPDEEIPRKPSPEELTATRARLKGASASGETVQGRVVAIVRGGYEVDVDGIVCLCPFNQIDLTVPRDQLAHVRQVYPFKVTSYKQRGRRVVLSRRKILEKEARRAAREALGRMQPGTDHEGIVTSLTDFGAFVDIGGVQGMAHVSEITHARISKPAEKLEVGQKVRAKVLKVDKRRGRLALSLKALEESPWKGIGRRLRPHQIVAGRVLRLTEFGAFVEVAPGVDGLIHLSEIPEARIEEYRKMAAEAAVVMVHVLKVEEGKRRISLAPAPEGLKAGDRVEMETLRPGRIIEATVEKADRNGVTVRITPAQTGFIPPNETGTPRGSDLNQAFPAGKVVKAIVMGERGGRGGRSPRPDRAARPESGDRHVRLSIRRAEREEERRQLDEYRRSASSGAGSFATLGDFFRPKGES